MLTNKQYFRRLMGIAVIGGGSFIGVEVVKNYVKERQLRFKSEYNLLKVDPNFYHNLHE